MKTKLVVYFLFLTTAVFASTEKVAPTLIDLKVGEVGYQGQILKRNHMFPVESILVGIPAKVHRENVCTHFVGQETKYTKKMDAIVVKGATDPMNDACIEIYPPPIETMLSVSFGVRNAVFPPSPQQMKKVKIGHTIYDVILDLQTEEVTVKPQAEPARG